MGWPGISDLSVASERASERARAPSQEGANQCLRASYHALWAVPVCTSYYVRMCKRPPPRPYRVLEQTTKRSPLAVCACMHSYELTPDGNSLDMMRGLLRRKLPA